MERTKRYYNIRDPQTGQFWTNRTNGKHPMTIDHETQAPIENLPVNLNLEGDESMIRQTLGKFADGIVKLSQFAKRIEELDTKVTDLEGRLGEATQARDRAIEDAAVARHDAEMARQAYDTANAKRIDAETQLAMAQQGYSDLSIEHGKLQSDHSFRGDEIDRLTNLLNLAQEERDQFRQAKEDLRQDLNDAEFKVLEFEETKQNLDIARRALDECAGNVVTWKERATTAENGVNTRNETIADLNTKISGLEASIKGLRENNSTLVQRLETIRRTVG